MSELIESPFQPIDHQLARAVCSWLNSDDELLYNTIMATSFALQQGHSCLSLELCLHEAPYRNMETFGFKSFPEPALWLAQLQQFAIGTDDDAPVVLHNQRVYLRRYFRFEQELAGFIHAHQQKHIALPPEKNRLAKALLDEFFPEPKGSDINWQKVAAANALLSSFTTIIGGPGTGKTYTVTRILALLASLADAPLNIKLAAPTGKAAQRLAESIRATKQTLTMDMLVYDSIPDDASTLHRLLGVIPNQIQFRHDADNPIDADVVLVDEVSMVDLPLMTRFIRALKPETRVFLLGDADQLPSVAAGSVLADIAMQPHPGYSKERCQSLKRLGISLTPANKGESLDRVTELIHSRRFDGDSGIGQLARAVIRGDARATEKLFPMHDDLSWVQDNDFDRQLEQWLQEHLRPIAQQNSLNDAYAALGQFRLLCATREGERGVIRLNERIAARLNYNRAPFFKGQPIMVTQNHYGLKLYNGDIGLVWPDENGQLMVWFEAGEDFRAVTPGRLPAHETVYAMTIHKTQGSEFGEVAVVLPQNPSFLLNRELIYTAITRAKQAVCIAGEQAIWQLAVAQKVERWAGLAEQIDELG